MIKITDKYLNTIENEVCTPIYNNLKEMLDKGFKVKYDLNTGSGTASKRSLSFDFDIGGENLYIKFESYTKNGAESVLDHLITLQRSMD